MKHFKKLHTHITHHHKKYIFGIFGSFALVKTILLVVGLFGLINVTNIFATGTATNVSITGTLLVGQTVTGSYVYVDVPWQPLGNRSFSSSGEANDISLALDGSGTPYVAYQDSAYSQKATVMKFNGSSREAIGGTGFSSGKVNDISFALDGSGTPYIAYTEASGTNRQITVNKYNETNRESLGSPGFSSGDVNDISFALDGSGTPYIAYQDNAYSYKATVMKFNGTNRESVGGTGFSFGGVNDISLALDGSGTPYVAYQDIENSYKATVMKFNGTSWEDVGSPGFSSGNVNDISLALDGSGTPYIAYQDNAYSQKATVMKFNGTSWEDVGSPGFSSGSIEYTSLFVYNGIPYVAYADYSDIGQATVMKFNGTSWEAVGSPKFSYDSAHYPSLFVYSGTPYIAFADYYSGNGQATVMKYRPDVEGSSIYQWYRNNTAITGATGLTYTIVTGDEGTTLQFEVTPISSGGITGVSASTAITIPVPIASAVIILGTPTINRTLTGSYTYTDATSRDPEGISTYQWYRNNIAITGATGLTYIITTGDNGATLKFEVTPISVSKTQGISKQSNGLVINSFPLATDVMITGILNIGETLTGSYTYSDNDINWGTVGIQKFSTGQATYISLFVYDEVPYIAYSDSYVGSGKAIAMKFNGTNWESVGSPGFSSGQVTNTSLFVYSGTPYVAFADSSTKPFGLASVMKFNGSNREYVDSQRFSSGQTNYDSLFIYNNTPYLAYQDIENSWKATVMKFNGTNWEPVGSLGFSSGGATYTSLFVYNETPYVAYSDYYAGTGQATVMKFNGTGWEPVGSPKFSSGQANDTSLFVWSGAIYLAYQDRSEGGRATVMKFNGTGWEPVGSPGFSNGAARYTSLFVYSGTPYIAFSDYYDIGQITVMKFNGTDWVNVGSSRFSSGQGDYPSLFVYNGTPYVAYTDRSDIGQATAMKTVLSDHEGVSTYQWYRNHVAITGATGLTYTLVTGDEGATITFEVTPIALLGSSPGIAVQSAESILHGPSHASCGNSVVESPETCDEGGLNGQAGHCNLTCNGIVAQPGGGVSIIPKDICTPDRDCSSSYYDHICGPCPSTGNVHNAANSCTAYSDELNSAYAFAYDNGITTIKNCVTANLDGTLIRSDLAKMVSQFVIKVLKKKPDTKKTVCTFPDMETKSKEMQFYATIACQLGLMGLETDGVTPKTSFDPNDIVDRAQFGTILSRILRGTTYAGESPFYAKHLHALKKNAIMNGITQPFDPEMRGRVMLMLQRSAEKK